MLLFSHVLFFGEHFQLDFIIYQRLPDDRLLSVGSEGDEILCLLVCLPVVLNSIKRCLDHFLQTADPDASLDFRPDEDLPPDRPVILLTLKSPFDVQLPQVLHVLGVQLQCIEAVGDFQCLQAF